MPWNKLEESEARFQILFDKSADAIFVLTLESRIERANQTACQRLGYSHDELVGRPISDFHGPESRVNVGSILQTILKAGSIRADVVHQARDGTLLPTEIHSHIVEVGGQLRILTTARDISERKRSESALRESANRYRQLFEHSGTANSIFDRDFRLVLANEMACRFQGLPADQLIGRTVEELLGPDLGADIRHRGERVFSTGANETVTREVRLPTGTRWFQTAYGALFDDAGAVVALQLISHDITELHQANEKLRQNEKLESIGVLAGGLAHDFNNLLAGLSGHLDLARMHLQEGRPADALARLDKSNQVFDRAKSLTHQLLTFSKGGTPIRELHILGPLLIEWADFALSGSDISLELEVAADLWLCECDALQIAQVVDNLLINARQMTPAGGTVSLRAENVVRETPMLAISVTDRGPGMTDETLLKIFDPYFTTKTKGSGLGLATSRSIVVQHGGSIEVETAPGKGSVFTVYLPALPGRRAALKNQARTDFRGSGRALLMDDEEAVRDTIGEFLISLGFEVTRARNGHDALAFDDKARQEGRPFALALLDLTIPGGMGGVETARQLQERGGGCKLVAMSGYSEQSGRTSLDSAGFLGMLTKPFSRMELTALLHRLFVSQGDSAKP